jgi:hypothetical protein
MDTKVNRSTTSIHIQMGKWGYNKKHLKTWDEKLIYRQQSYNKEVHTSISKSDHSAMLGFPAWVESIVSYFFWN